MLKLDENVQNVSLVEELINAKTQTLPHSISTKEEAAKPVYKVYVEKADETSVGSQIDTTDFENPELGKAVQLQTSKTAEDWAEFFSNNTAKCDECLQSEDGAINVSVKTNETKTVKVLGDDSTFAINASLAPENQDISTTTNASDEVLVVCKLSAITADGVYGLKNISIKVHNEDTSKQTSSKSFNLSNLESPEVKLTRTTVDGVVSFELSPETVTYTDSNNVQKVITLVSDASNSELVVNLKTDTLLDDSLDGTSIVLSQILEEEQPVFVTKTIAKVNFGQDGYNKNHTQKNAIVTKNSNYINGLKIAIHYTVDELRFVTLGTLKPATAQITLNESLIVNDNVVNDIENQTLLEKIYELNEICNVECTTINRSEETPAPISDWDPDLSEIEELHPQDENGNPLENLIEGSIRLQTSEIPDAYGTDEAQQEGCVILADRPVKQIIDEYDFPRLVLDDTAVTSNGVLNRFRSVEIKEKDATEAKVFFEKESYSVGKVFYNTGVIELNNAVPVIEGVAPSLRCSVRGMQNLKCNIINKGTDGNKYSIKINKDHVEVNGDVIYNLSLVLNNSELETIQCTSNPDGSIIEGYDASGNLTDVEVPYIGSIEHDVFQTSFIGNEKDLKNLHDGTYSCVGGTDGVDGITAKDYIGYKDESGTAGAWLFDDVKYPAQMWPSLGYTDKDFYMAAQDIAWNRKDTTCVWDVPKGYSKKSAINYREEEPIPSNWWTELYYNWCNDVFNGAIVELPPSYYVTKNSLASYKVNGTWYPVAGKERGTIDAASVINQVPAKLDRDEFITHNINPIYDTGNQGIQIYGNETLNAQYTDLSAAHIARTLTYIRSKVDTYTETLKFELNDVILWRTWIDYVTTKIVQPIKAARGLQWFRISMGSETTTAAELANRIVRGVIELQFVPDAEIFKLDYIVYSSAADNSTF